MAEPESAEEPAGQTQEPEEKAEVQLPEAATLLGAAITSPKPIPKTIWQYTAQPPIITTAVGALAVANPALAIAVFPALGIGTKLGKRLEDVQENLQWKVAPYVAPASVVEYKYKMAWRKALWAIPKALLYRNFSLETPFGRYKYKDFWPTALLGSGISRVFERASGGRADSVFKKAADNLKPYTWNRKEGVKANRKRRGLWGVIVGLVIVDFLGTLVSRFAQAVARKVLGQARWLKVTRTLKGPGRVAGAAAGGAFSLDTVAGGAVGFVATGGNPLGVAIGAIAGGGYRFVKNLSEILYTETKFAGKIYADSDLLFKERLEKAYGIDALTPGEKRLLKLQRPTEFLSPAKQLTSLRSGLLSRIPLKGFAVGFVLSGGNPVVGLIFSGYQLGWSLKGYLPNHLTVTYANNYFYKKFGVTFGSFGELAQFLTYKGLGQIPLGPFASVRSLSFGEWLSGAKAGNVYKVHWTRNLVGAQKGGVIAAAITIPFAVFGIAPAWLPLAAYGTGMGINFGWRAFQNRFFPTKVSPAAEGFLTRMGRRFPYWKGAGAGFLLSALLTGLGIPPAAALALGLGAGIGGQILWKRFLSQILGKKAGPAVAGVGAKLGAAPFLVRLPFKVIPIIGWGYAVLDFGIRMPFSLGAEAIEKYALKPLEEDYAAGKISKWRYLTAKAAIEVGYWILKAPAWLIDKILWPLDKLSELGFKYVIAPILAPVFSGLFRVLGFLLTGLAHLPIVGGFFGAIKDFFSRLFGGAKAVATGLVGALLGLVGAVISLLTGGDITEAAFIGAIGLILAGVVITTALEPEPGTGFEPINLIKTATPNHIENDATDRTVEFKITIEAPDRDITNITCTDSLTTALEVRDISVPCPRELAAGETFEHTFSYDIPADPALNDTIVSNMITVEGEAQTTPFDIPSCEGVPPASDGDPTNGIETSVEELECYIIQQAQGVTEPLSGQPLEQVMLAVMNGESSGNQCNFNNTAGAVGVFQFIASTWKGNTDPAYHNLDSGSVHAGSVTPALGENGCWGNLGEEPALIPPLAPGCAASPESCNWVVQFGQNLDGQAWNPFVQINTAKKMMEAGEACQWDVFRNNFSGC